MKNTLKGLLKILALLLMCGGAMIAVSSGNHQAFRPNGLSAGDRDYLADFETACAGMTDSINREIFDLPKVYTLHMDQSPAPEPDPDGFTEDTYNDPTISVKCWKEKMNVAGVRIVANFAEITIAHPTQLRTAFAGGQFGSTRLFASKIAGLNHAVVAVNADFYNYRTNGLIIRNGTVYREKPYGADVLLIDSNGDFTVMSDEEAVNEGYYKKNKIYQSLSFGPVMINNGEPVKVWHTFSCGPYGKEPRTGIGQIGPLHYLLCTVDGRMESSPGVSVADLGKIMADKNCRVAYNLDGGQSSVLYFHNKIFNVVADGGERTLSDILYFATAIPENERA